MNGFTPLVDDDVRPVKLWCSADASKRAPQKTGRFVVSFQEPGGTAQFSLLHRSSHFGTGGFCSRMFWHENSPRNQISVPCGAFYPPELSRWTTVVFASFGDTHPPEHLGSQRTKKDLSHMKSPVRLELVSCWWFSISLIWFLKGDVGNYWWPLVVGLCSLLQCD